MHRIDSATAEADKFGSGKDGYTEGDPAAGVPPTETTDDWFDAVQEELAAPIENYGGTLIKADNHQFMRTYRMMLSRMAIGGLQEVVGITGEYFFGVAVNSSGITGSEAYAVAVGLGVIASSDDGYTWTDQSMGAGFAGLLSDVAYGVGSGAPRWVAVGGSGSVKVQTAAGPGATWTNQTPAASGGTGFNRVIWSSELSLFVAVGQDGEIQTSPDGTVWTKRTPAGAYTGHFVDVASSPSALVAVGRSSAAIQRSADGITWADVTPGGAADLYGVAYGDGILLAVTRSGTAYISDDDGATWSSKTITTLSMLRRPVFSSAFGWVIGMESEGPAVLRDPVNEPTLTVYRAGQYRQDLQAYGVAADDRMVLVASNTTIPVLRSLSI